MDALRGVNRAPVAPAVAESPVRLVAAQAGAVDPQFLEA
jgi:hypothetical protein